MPDLPPDLAREVRRTLIDLRAAQLAATAWPVVAGDLARLAVAVERGDVDLVRASLVPISQATFEGKVRGRLAGADKPAAMVVATKPTSALPAVGAVSAALLIGIGYLLGGWVVAGLTARVRAVHLRRRPGRHPHHHRPSRAPREQGPRPHDGADRAGADRGRRRPRQDRSPSCTRWPSAGCVAGGTCGGRSERAGAGCAQFLRMSLKGLLESTPASLGRPSTRSPTMLRSTSSEPPAMRMPGTPVTNCDHA